MTIFAIVEWDASAVVIVIAALGAMVVQIITAWRTSSVVAATHAKVETIEHQTDGMNAALENTRRELAIELTALKAANLAAIIEQRDRAEAKVEKQTIEITRRADAKTPEEDKP